MKNHPKKYVHGPEHGLWSSCVTLDELITLNLYCSFVKKRELATPVQGFRGFATIHVSHLVYRKSSINIGYDSLPPSENPFLTSVIGFNKGAQRPKSVEEEAIE